MDSKGLIPIEINGTKYMVKAAVSKNVMELLEPWLSTGCPIAKEEKPAEVPYKTASEAVTPKAKKTTKKVK